MYFEPSLISKMDLLAKTVKGFQLLTIFTKSSILDVWLSSEYASDNLVVKQDKIQNSILS